jgi:hypothetical protein
LLEGDGEKFLCGSVIAATKNFGFKISSAHDSDAKSHEGWRPSKWATVILTVLRGVAD